MIEDCDKHLEELKRATLYFLAVPNDDDPDIMEYKVNVSVDQTPEEALEAINTLFPNGVAVVYSYEAIGIFDELMRWDSLNDMLNHIDLGDEHD